MSKVDRKQIIAAIGLVIIIIFFCAVVLFFNLILHLWWEMSMMLGVGVTFGFCILLAKVFTRKVRKEGVRYILSYSYDCILKEYGLLNISIKKDEDIRKHVIGIMFLMQKYYKNDKFCFIWNEHIDAKEKERKEVVDHQNINLMLDNNAKLNFQAIQAKDKEGWFYCDTAERVIHIEGDSMLIEYIISNIGGGVN